MDETSLSLDVNRLFAASLRAGEGSFLRTISI